MSLPDPDWCLELRWHSAPPGIKLAYSRGVRYTKQIIQYSSTMVLILGSLVAFLTSCFRRRSTVDWSVTLKPEMPKESMLVLHRHTLQRLQGAGSRGDGHFSIGLGSRAEWPLANQTARNLFDDPLKDRGSHEHLLRTQLPSPFLQMQAT